jgi:SAM-dependent methyltransferase
MISKSDIFRAAVGDMLPIDTQEEYHDWLSRHYDLFTGWDERLKNEIPDLTNLFKKEKVGTIIDIGCGTGEHDIALAKKGFKVLGLEKSKSMYEVAIYKKNKLRKDLKEKVDFINGDYEKLLGLQKEKYDAAVFMGNAFPHLANQHKKVLKSTIKALSNNSLIVFQIINFEKVFNVKNRILEFNFPKTPTNAIYEYGFLEFYDLPREDKSTITLNMFIFNYDGKGWNDRSRNSTKIAYLKQDDITKLLKKEGFKKISIYGSMFRKPLFKNQFKLSESDWLIVVARK